VYQELLKPVDSSLSYSKIRDGAWRFATQSTCRVILPVCAIGWWTSIWPQPEFQWVLDTCNFSPCQSVCTNTPYIFLLAVMAITLPI